MKKIAFLLSLLLPFVVAKADTTPLANAIKNGSVRAELSSEGGFNGRCLRLTVRNKTKKTLSLQLPAGQYLMPDDSSMQRLLSSETLLFTLKANDKAAYKFYAFCSQQHRHSPKLNATFRIGKRASKAIAELAELVEQRKLNGDFAAQEAVWCLTDNAPVQNIMSRNAADELALRQYVAAIKGIDLTKIPTIKRTPQIYEEVGRQNKKLLLDRDTVNYNTANTQGIIKNMKIRAADKVGTTKIDPTGAHTQDIKAAQAVRTAADQAEYEAQKALQGTSVKEIKGILVVDVATPCRIAIEILKPSGEVLSEVYKSSDVVQGKGKFPYKYQEFGLPKGIYAIRAINIATKQVLKTETAIVD